MSETIIGYIIIFGSIAVMIHATLGRILGFHRPIPWQGGGECSLVGEMSMAAFFLSFGLGMAVSPGWFIGIFPTWVMGFVSQWRANRRHQKAEQALRTRNAARYPGVFETEPPDDLDATDDQGFDLYDAGSCIHLGVVGKSDIKVLIDTFSYNEDLGPNDIFIFEDTFGFFLEGALTEHCEALLKEALKERDELILRWLPSSQNEVLLPGRAENQPGAN